MADKSEFHTPVLETPRLRLRPINGRDADAMYRYYGDWDVMKYQPVKTPNPYELQDAIDDIYDAQRRMSRRTSHVWTLTARNDPKGKLMGVMEYYLDNAANNRAFWLGKPFQGKGLMTEAAMAMNDFAFNQCNEPFLCFISAEENKASNQLKIRSGAVVTSTFQDEFHGGQMSCLAWKLTPEAWAEHRPSILFSTLAKAAATPRPNRGESHPAAKAELVV